MIITLWLCCNLHVNAEINKDKPQSLINTQCPSGLLWNTNCLRLAFTAGNVAVRLQIVQVSLVTFSVLVVFFYNSRTCCELRSMEASPMLFKAKKKTKQNPVRILQATPRPSGGKTTTNQ